MIDTKNKNDVIMMCHMIVTGVAFVFAPVGVYHIVEHIAPLPKDAEIPVNIPAVSAALITLSSAALCGNRLIEFAKNMGGACHRLMNPDDKPPPPQPL